MKTLCYIMLFRQNRIKSHICFPSKPILHNTFRFALRANRLNLLSLSLLCCCLIEVEHVMCKVSVVIKGNVGRQFAVGNKIIQIGDVRGKIANIAVASDQTASWH